MNKPVISEGGFLIASPSWMRARTAFTHEYFEDVNYVVCKSQAEGYRERGLNVWECPDSAQGNLCRVRNWILDNTKIKNVLIIDDDFSALGFYDGHIKLKFSSAEAIEVIESYFDLANQLGVKFWGVNCSSDKGVYSEHKPFSFNNYIGGPFQAFINCPLRYDEALPLKEDYDMTLQVMNRYRKALRVNHLHYMVKQHTNKGGCASYRTVKKEQEQFKLLEKKWGSKIVRTDSRDRKGQVKETLYDINPIIKIPIAGI